MATGSEYEFERPCCEYWLGIAEGRGVTIAVPDSSPLLKATEGTYGLYERQGVSLTGLLDDLTNLEQQRRDAVGDNDPELGKAVMGAMQYSKSLIGRTDARFKGIEYEYVGGKT